MDKDENIWLHVLRALVELADEKALPYLEDFLKKEENPKIRKRILHYIAEIDIREAIDVLGQIARHDPDLGV
ncbi:MAG: HEAT repeat domain-containing protein [bacterium]